MTIALIILGVLVLGVVLWFFGAYNGLIKLRNLVQEAWAQIDVELKRRHDLIGNLVETVKGYAAHEKTTLEEVTRARAGAVSASQGNAGPAEVAKAEAALTQALVRLTMVAEAYPDLRASENFRALQAELTSTEDRIASARRYYNANVRELNTKVETIPTNFVAGPAGVHKAEYFEVESAAEREAPQVSFDPGPPAGAQQLPPQPARSPIQDAAAPPPNQPPTQ
ncbi:MAG: LemA family protein [Dermatophilaceae bacterium]